LSVCRWVVSTRYGPMRLCYGWWAASYREQSEKQLGALYDVRATSVWFLHGLYHAGFYAELTALRK